jgi:hypothetical protein
MKNGKLKHTIITVPATTSDGTKCTVNCAVLDELNVDGFDYLVIMPLEKEDQISIRFMRYGERDGVWGYLPVHGIREEDRVHEAFLERIRNHEA